MKKQKMLNRVSSLILAVVMVLGLCVSPVATQQANAGQNDEISASMKIVATQDNLTIDAGQVEEIASYFSVQCEGMTYFWESVGTYYCDELADSNSEYQKSYKALTISFAKVEANGSETALNAAPSEPGTYKAYASVRNDGSNYFYVKSEDDWLGYFYPYSVESGSLQFTIAGDGSEDVQIDVNMDNLKLLYGDEKLADEDAYVLLVLGDGFTESEQSKFYEKAAEFAKGFMATSPFDEMTNTIKIYAYGTVSKESGARGDKSSTYAEALADTRDTYYNTHFWESGMQRLVYLNDEGLLVAKTVKKKVMPAADCSLMLVNSDTYGGGGGMEGVATCSLTYSFVNVALHELGHSIAGLADEYWPGAVYASENKPNLTTESDPEKVKWSRFVGKNGIGVYKHDQSETSTDWYKPSQTCTMEAVANGFCDVCKEALRQSICKNSNVSALFFQPYADEFYVGETGKDMSEYFILRKGDKEVTGNQLGDKLTLVYKDSDGNVVDGIPNKEGTYTIEATFAGNDTFDACTASGTYNVELDLIKLSVSDKAYDGKAAQVSCTVNDGYSVKLHYSGTQYAVSEIAYDSSTAPTKPGKYTVEATAYDNATGEEVTKKTKSFEITNKVKDIVNNNSSVYPGASVAYNIKKVVFVGEGFTAAEQSKFEKAAKEYADYILSTEPFKQVKTYFNFVAIDTISNVSGIGTKVKNTYFGVTYDKNGKLADTNAYAASSIAYDHDPYTLATIVIVNDSKNVKTGNSVSVGQRQTIFGGLNTASKQYAARELLNFFTGHKVGYKATSTSAKAKQSVELFKKLYTYWDGLSYAVIAGNAYSKEFVAGKKVDMSGCFKTYIDGTLVPSSKVKYKYTYYKNGKKLSSVPSTAGTYTVVAEILPPESYGYDENYNVFKITSDHKLVEVYEEGYGYYTQIEDAEGNCLGWPLEWNFVEVGGQTHFIPRARGTSTFTIVSAATAKKQFQAKKNTLSSVKSSAKKSLTATWTTISNATGYQVQYSTNSSFKGAKTVTVTGASSKTKTIKSLSSKKKYYVRVRAYKTVNGTKVYSKWTAKKSVTVK